MTAYKTLKKVGEKLLGLQLGDHLQVHQQKVSIHNT